MSQDHEPFLNNAAKKRLLIASLTIILICFFFECCGDSIGYLLEDHTLLEALNHFFHNIISPGWWLDGIRSAFIGG